MNVEKIHEVSEDVGNGWSLCFQWCHYHHPNGYTEKGYRFIYEKPNGHLQPARGQARIPSLKLARILMARAEREGWGDYDWDKE
ncbi:MAG: hypothetical protein ACWGKN_08620 [Desulfoprunum sp.]|jgi:hypothetical protein